MSLPAPPVKLSAPAPPTATTRFAPVSPEAFTVLPALPPTTVIEAPVTPVKLALTRVRLFLPPFARR